FILEIKPKLGVFTPNTLSGHAPALTRLAGRIFPDKIFCPLPQGLFSVCFSARFFPECPVNGKPPVLRELLNRADVSMNQGFVWKKTVGHQPQLAAVREMRSHLGQELLSHGGIGFDTGVERRVTDYRRPTALNGSQAIGGKNLTVYSCIPVTFPGTEHGLRLNIGTVHPYRGLTCCLMKTMQPGSDNAGATGEIQHPINA